MEVEIVKLLLDGTWHVIGSMILDSNLNNVRLVHLLVHDDDTSCVIIDSDHNIIFKGQWLDMIN